MDGRAQEALPLLDHHHLDELAHHIGAAATHELLAEGRAELADRLGRLSEAVRSVFAGSGPGGRPDLLPVRDPQDWGGRPEGAPRAPAQGHDAAEIAILAHQASGLAGTLGLPLVAQHAARASEAARSGDDPREALAALGRTAPPSLVALERWNADRCDCGPRGTGLEAGRL